jgi:two-component system response regulator HydG
MKKHALIVDDDANLCAVLETELTARGYRVTVSQTPGEALGRIGVLTNDLDVILTDFNMQSISGADLCERTIASGCDAPVVVMTAFGSMDSAVAAMKAGAYDYVTKPLDANDLALTLERAVRDVELRREARQLRLEMGHEEAFEQMIGSSSEMLKVFDLIERVATTDVTVLLTGESGTGKELAARALHARSACANGPFIAINCAAMPESLLEAELFGHTRGAFTDAHRSRIGLFVKANGGTIFLDEIGEMPAGMQAKLLRTLQERRVRPIGGEDEVPFDARIVTATNRNLEAEVAAKRFREDLFYRVNVACIALPPLRARNRDILCLAKHFMQSCQPTGQHVIGLRPPVIEALLSYHWPGNVRELQNCIQRAVALAQFDHIGCEDLPETICNLKSEASFESTTEPKLVTVRELERRYIGHVLKTVDGNKTLAARILGFDRRTLYRKLDSREALTSS